jgi:hypothetical protein
MGTRERVAQLRSLKTEKKEKQLVTFILRTPRSLESEPLWDIGRVVLTDTIMCAKGTNAKARAGRIRGKNETRGTHLERCSSKCNGDRCAKVCKELARQQFVNLTVRKFMIKPDQVPSPLDVEPGIWS